jgi:hypothetical protein
MQKAAANRVKNASRWLFVCALKSCTEIAHPATETFTRKGEENEFETDIGGNRTVAPRSLEKRGGQTKDDGF